MELTWEAFIQSPGSLLVLGTALLVSIGVGWFIQLLFPPGSGGIYTTPPGFVFGPTFGGVPAWFTQELAYTWGFSLGRATEVWLGSIALLLVLSILLVFLGYRRRRRYIRRQADQASIC